LFPSEKQTVSKKSEKNALHLLPSGVQLSPKLGGNMNLSNFAKYDSKKKGYPKDFNPTHKWVEYTIDVKEMRRLLLAANFEDKARLNRYISIAERKREWHYRRDDFDLKTANIILSAINV
jgi:hypothetical protein